MPRSKIAEELREEQTQDVLAMTPDERVALAFAAGQRDLEFLMSANGLTREEAYAQIERARRIGRRPSRSNDD